MNADKHASLKDDWTHDPDYRRCFQTDEDIHGILRLLAIDGGSALVDIGCGNGAFAIAAAQKNPLCRVWAFDALDSAVAECQARAADLRNIHVARAWAHAIPLGPATVDRALFRSVLHHIAEPQAVYTEIGRILMPGCRLVLQAPCNDWEPAFSHVLSELMMLADDSHRRFYYRPAEIIDGLRSVGFTPGEPERWPYPFSFISDEQAAFIRRHRAEEKLHLRPVEPGKWSIEGRWVRIVAAKQP